jgi:hypothetical protein
VVDVGRITMLMSYVNTNPATWPTWLLQQHARACKTISLRIGDRNAAAAVMFEPTSNRQDRAARLC